MKTLIMLFVLSPAILLAQDYLKLSNGDKLNVKIISVTDSIIEFERAGVVKRIPEKEVKQILYNKTTNKEFQLVDQDQTKDYKFSYPPHPVAPPIPVDHLGNAKIFTISSGVFLGIALFSSTAAVLLTAPTEPIGNIAYDDYIDYLVEQQTYEQNKKLLLGAGVASFGISLGCLVLGNYERIQFLETKNANLSLKQNGLGIGLCYTFK